jgi:3-oxoacyl-[acyl-carrier-protein] synthase III
MTIATIEKVAVRGIVTVVPEARIDNLDVSEENLRNRQRLIKNIGIRYRHICKDGMIFSDMAQRSVELLLEGLKWQKDSIDALILVTQSPEYLIPATSIIIQNRLGLSTSTSAFDINLGCSGYTYGLFTCAAMIGEKKFKRVVVIVGDQSASNGSPDNGREVLFGDACSATALEFDDEASNIYFEGNSDGSGFEAIIVPHGGKKNPFNESSLRPMMWEDGVERNPLDVRLDGPAIMNFSIKRAPESIINVLKSLNKTVDDIDFFIMHQANKMINDTIKFKVGGDVEQWPLSLEEYGNTSSTSIPITITGNLSEKASTQKIKWLTCGFGIGLSWGTLYFETDKIYCPKPFKIK